MRISVIGAGAWGGALAKVLSDNDHEVLMYTYSKEQCLEINEKHVIKALDAKIPEDIIATNDLEEAIKFSKLYLVAVPTKAMREVLNQMKEIGVYGDFINVSKGIEPSTSYTMSQVYKEVLGDSLKTYSVLTGPSHAEEVVKNMLTVVVAASENFKIAKQIQKMFSNKEYFRVYASDDLVGAEIGGSLKNVIALASGFIKGLGQGDNGTAALITRSMIEIERIGLFYGAKRETIYGLTGLGDLIVTAMSVHSRNYNAGIKLANGTDINSLNTTVEGARTCKSVHELIVKHNIDAPIFKAIYEILYEGKPILDVIPSLLERKLKSE